MNTASPDLLRDTLRRTFGFDALRPGQEAVMTRLLAGRSALAIFPTGGGKSLCYQLPALLLDGLTLVVSPLIALMKDQIDFLTRVGVPAARLDSSLDAAESRRVHDDLRAGRLKLLYVAPERLGSERFLQTLGRLPIALMAVDEAHCISEWGHNFRPDYLKLARLARSLEAGRVLALTATATPDVARDVARGFGIDPEDIVQTGFYRPNLEYRVSPTTAAERDDLLLERLGSRPRGPAIVYVTLQRTAEAVAGLLASRGFDARPYHAGLEAETRHATQEWFMAGREAIVAATIAFGMGIDKPDIRSVYHYNLPGTLENYAQETGRAGRDGRPSVCELLACPEDRVTLENFTYGDTPTPEAVSALLDSVLSLGPRFDLSIHELSTACDIRPLVVETALTYLELAGILESTGPFYSEYQFQPQRPSAEILAAFDARRAAFLRDVFRQAKKGRTWLTLDAHAAAEALNEPRDRIIKAIHYLEERGDLVVRASGVRQGYRLLLPDADRPALASRLADRFSDHERRQVARLDTVIAYASETGCRVRHLLSYFGESLASACGHCDTCLGVPPSPLPPIRRPPLGPAEASLVRSIRSEGHPALSSPRALARFLCGLSSPATSRAKLSRHPLFGALGDRRFAEVMALVENGSSGLSDRGGSRDQE